MTIDMKKIWFVDGAIIEETIPEAEIYDPKWCVDYCKSYAEQLRDKTRANRAEHAAECIEYLLSVVQKEWVGLTDDPIGWIYEDDEGRMMFSQMPHPDPLWEPVYRGKRR